MMCFPTIRHLAFYEYLVSLERVTGAYVIDFGHGNAWGAMFMIQDNPSMNGAASVIGIDHDSPYDYNHELVDHRRLIPNKDEKMCLVMGDIFESALGSERRYDLVTAIDVLQCVVDPLRLCAKAAELGEWFFVTTPLVENTRETSNPQNVLEYSSHDFIGMLVQHFDIVEVAYQLPDLSMLAKAEPFGDSTSPHHVIQTALCRRKTS